MQQLTAIPPVDRPRPGSGAMFDSIAGRYDLLNRILSLGLDRRWRARAVAAVTGPGSRVLDLATGTADLAIEVLRQHADATVVGIDPSPRMLAEGERKVSAAGLASRIELRPGRAEELPFDDDSFDAAAIAWGIRNVADRPAALAEMARVVRPGGKIAILEGSEPRSGLLAPFARFYLHHVVPRLGAWLSKERAYRYLQTSIEAFPPPPEFAEIMERAGLEVTEIRDVSFGVGCLFLARPAEKQEVPR
ncbi:MAG: bifunctional demethylmenaquinone methyltransferase/2-methoxy-6-polyprenyl-1,4-benzoquinol methylase UbiE [bacterium]|nr:bifunctional demethylmenaquinone methyltransferase/2-methoxy-6-polyprenyl-1,4-benzoquinol methylase UbiE [bacterium]